MNSLTLNKETVHVQISAQSYIITTILISTEPKFMTHSCSINEVSITFDTKALVTVVSQLGWIATEQMR